MIPPQSFRYTEGPLSDFYGSEAIDTSSAIVATSPNHAYVHFAKSNNDREGWLIRFTYDAASNKMSYEDLTPSVKDVLGKILMPEFERSGGKDSVENHFALAGLPDGVAILGSPTAGEDTHIIKDGSTELITYPRTSCYHQMFHALATYGDGYLYAMGNNATEPDVMYFRSTQYQQQTPGPEPTPKPTPSVTTKPSVTSSSSLSSAHAFSNTAKASKSSGKLPKTGDETDHSMTLAALGLCAMAIAVRVRKRESC